MTIATVVNKVVAQGNGATTAFSFAFLLPSAAYAVVTVTDSTGVQTVLLSTQYSLSGIGNPNGGTVNYPLSGSPLPSGSSIALQRVIPLQQLTSLVNQGGYFPAVVEGALDQLEMQIQQLAATTGGNVSLQFPATDALTLNSILPAAAARANNLLSFDSLGNVIVVAAAAQSATALAIQLLDTTSALNGDALVGVKRTLANAVATTEHLVNEARIVNVKSDFGAVGDGATDDTTAITNAIAGLGSRGTVFLPRGTYKVTSSISITTSGIRLVGEGFSEINGTGAGNRGATCILRAFVGANPTLSFQGDDCGIDLIDVDNNSQGTGDCVQWWGGRADIGVISCRNSGGDGFRAGRTNAGASSTNTNCGVAKRIIACGNAGAGARWDDTNTTTSTSYPLGVANANGWAVQALDLRSNGSDNLQLGNCNDNVFTMVVSQSSTGGCGIRFKTDGTNSGPRCNKILGSDCESNFGNDIQIDAATLPATAPGLYNVVFGNRSIAVTSRIVDNSTGSLVIQWRQDLATGKRAYHFGETLNVVNVAASGVAEVSFFADTVTRNVARAYAQQVSAGGKWSLQTFGASLADRLIVDRDITACLTGLSGGVLFNKTAVDNTTSGVNIEGGAVGRIDIVNSGAGTKTVASFFDASGAAGSITTNGSGTAAYLTTSDERLKQDIVPMASQGSVIDALKPRQFAFKADPNKTVFGFIAQELHEVYPDAVHVGGDDPKENPWGTDDSKLMAVMVKELQELRARVAALEAARG